MEIHYKKLIQDLMTYDNPKNLTDSIKDMNNFISEFYIQPFLNYPNFFKRFLQFPTFSSQEIVAESVFILVRISELNSGKISDHLFSSGLLNLLQYFFSTSFYNNIESYVNQQDIIRLKFVLISNLMLQSQSREIIIRNFEKSLVQEVKNLKYTSKIYKYAMFALCGQVAYGFSGIQVLVDAYNYKMDNDTAFIILDTIYQYSCKNVVKNLQMEQFGNHISSFGSKKLPIETRRTLNALLKILVNLSLELDTIPLLTSIASNIVELIKNEDQNIQLAGWQLILTISSSQNGAEQVGQTWLFNYIIRGINIINRMEPLQILQNLYFYSIIMITSPDQISQICDSFRFFGIKGDKEKQKVVVEILQLMASNKEIKKELLSSDLIQDMIFQGYFYEATNIQEV